MTRMRVLPSTFGPLPFPVRDLFQTTPCGFIVFNQVSDISVALEFHDDIVPGLMPSSNGFVIMEKR